MCILMIIYQGLQSHPIALAANRDEFYKRSTQGPHLLAQTPPAWGGKDEQAGGTWLGVNAHGLVVGLTNRRMSDKQENDPQRRSRGLLCLEALRQRSAQEAAAFLTDQAPDIYNPFNLLLADQDALLWIAYDNQPRIHRLEPGLHILANGNIDDFETVRIRRARQLLQCTAQMGPDVLMPLLEEVCRDHEVGVQDRETICMHREDEKYGTVSSTILALAAQKQDSLYRYASGHPCTTPYQDYSTLISHG